MMREVAVPETGNFRGVCPILKPGERNISATGYGRSLRLRHRLATRGFYAIPEHIYVSVFKMGERETPGTVLILKANARQIF